MGAPATTTRQTPAGRVLKNGHSTKIAFAKDPDVSFWEVTVKPPGMDAGDMIDLTTMFNTFWGTGASRNLVRSTPFSGTCLYDPNVFNNIVTNVILQEGAITIRDPDGSTLDFFGALKSFVPQERKEGEPAMADFEGFVTNRDPTDGAEQGPVLTSVSGT